MSDLLATIRGELDTRMHELRPFVSEYERLLAGATDEQTTHYAAHALPGTSPGKTSPVPTIPAAVGTTEARPQTERHTDTNQTMTRLATSRLHRPRRALLRPAFPKAPRRG